MTSLLIEETKRKRMTNEELEQIEISNKEAQAAIEKSEALKSLLEDPRYKLIISEGFLKTYPEELGIAIATNTGAYDPDALVDLLKGVNSFVGYTFQVVQNGRAGEQTLRDNEAYIAAQEAEEVENGEG